MTLQNERDTNNGTYVLSCWDQDQRGCRLNSASQVQTWVRFALNVSWPSFLSALEVSGDVGLNFLLCVFFSCQPSAAVPTAFSPKWRRKLFFDAFQPRRPLTGETEVQVSPGESEQADVCLQDNRQLKRNVVISSMLSASNRLFLFIFKVNMKLNFFHFLFWACWSIFVLRGSVSVFLRLSSAPTFLYLQVLFTR